MANTPNNPPVELFRSDTPVSYEKAISFMKKRVACIIAGTEPQAIWFLEHEHVYTAGTSANDNELLIPNKIPHYKTGRGGKYTYHGPGQRVVYVMLNLKQIHNNKPDVHLFVKQMEIFVISSLARLGIKAETRDGNIGVWVKNAGQDEKIAAIGVRIEKWVTYHGVAINVNPELGYFQGIIPCGNREAGVTSLHQLGYQISLEEFDQVLLEKLKNVFQIENVNNFLTPVW